MYSDQDNKKWIRNSSLYQKIEEVSKFPTTPNTDFSSYIDQINELLIRTKNYLLNHQSSLQRVDGGTIYICGDIHGQFADLMRIFNYTHRPGGDYKFVFLGDYVDRGMFSLETIIMLFCLMLLHPGNVVLLRGNHECASISKAYGFYNECTRRIGFKGPTMWKRFMDTFDCLPIAAIVGDRIFCVHGGLSPELANLEQIEQLRRPVDVPEAGLLCDLLWSDPKQNLDGWDGNDRGCSYTFGENVVLDFCEKFEFDLVCRAHQVVEDGYEFFAKRKLVTIFSAPNYTGEFSNCGAILCIEPSLRASLKVLRPLETPENVKSLGLQYSYDGMVPRSNT